MPPLLDDDDDASVESPSGKPSAKERLAERIGKTKTAPTSQSALEVDEEGPVIDLSERDDDEGDDDRPAAAAEEERPRGQSRLEKKRNRYREMQERMSAAEQARRESDERFSKMMSLYERTLASREPAQAPGKDEFDARLEGIYHEQEVLYSELQQKARTLTQQDKDRIEKRAKELDAEKIAVSVQKHIRAQGMQPNRGPAETMQAMLSMEFPEVVAHDDALGWAQGYYQMARREGRAGSIDLARESMQKARQRFRIGGVTPARRPPATSAQAEKYAGVGRGGGGGGHEDEPERIVMNKDFRKLANGKYGHIKDEKKRYEMWARGPGRRLLQSQRAGKHSM